MPGVFSIQRFGLVSETMIEELKKCKRGVVQTKILQKNRGKRARIEKLINLIETFYAEVEDKNGDDSEPDKLKVMIAALDRHLNEKGYKFSIRREREFHSSKQVLV